MRNVIVLGVVSTSLPLLVACAEAGGDGADEDGWSTSSNAVVAGAGGGDVSLDGSSTTVATAGVGGSEASATVTATTGVGGDPSATSATSSAAASVTTSAVATTSSGVTATSSGQGGGSPGQPCAHDICVDGAALTADCDPCANTVCASDPFCCNNAWDQLCVSATAQLCANDPCGLLGASSSSATGGGGGSTVLPGDLLITEIMNNPAKVDDSKGEWFEVYNSTPGPIDLKGLVIRHQLVAVDPNAVETISKSFVIPAFGYAVLGNNGDVASNGGVKVDYVYSAKVSLNNSKDHLAIETAEVPATTIDASTYDSAKLSLSGKSRSLDPAAMTMFGNDDDTNFCGSKSLIPGSTDFGTPGAPNDSCK